MSVFLVEKEAFYKPLVTLDLKPIAERTFDIYEMR